MRPEVEGVHSFQIVSDEFCRMFLRSSTITIDGTANRSMKQHEQLWNHRE